MEDHLKNKNRLEKEWEALCAYQAEPNSSLVAQREENAAKNRSLAVLTCMYLARVTRQGVGTLTVVSSAHHTRQGPQVLSISVSRPGPQLKTGALFPLQLPHPQKPVSLSASGARALRMAAEVTGIPVGTVCSSVGNRWDPVVRELTGL